MDIKNSRELHIVIKLILFLAVSVLSVYIYFVFFSPLYSPANSKYEFNTVSMEHGMEISSKLKNSRGEELLIVQSELYFENPFESCNFIYGIRKNPKDENGNCYPEWCEAEGYFIVDKMSSSVKLGITKAEFEKSRSENTSFLYSGNYIWVLNRAILSLACPSS